MSNTIKRCVGIKREGESCTKNNNCKYPNCPPTFDEFYKPPYKNDWGVVMSSNNNWAWTFKGYMNDESHQDLVMKMISGEIEGRLVKDRLMHEGGEIFFTKHKEDGETVKKMIMQIRGWGGLTGTGGGLGLDPEVACKIQDDFCDWIISKISK